jgi:hypothetical protein
MLQYPVGVNKFEVTLTNEESQAITGPDVA